MDIAVENIGPVELFQASLDRHGVWVLRGPHGSGKTTIQRLAELATNGATDVRPTKSDGTKRGEAQIAGKTLRITTQVREEGDLLVEGLGDLSIATLHTPKYQEATTRDRHRIKALTRLAGVGADASLFHLVGGGKAHFEAVIEADTLKTDDLVEMSGRVKRAFEKRAQVKEDEQRVALARATAAADQCQGLDLATAHDATELQARLTMAIAERTRVTTQRKDGLDRIAQADRSRAAMVSAHGNQAIDVATAKEHVRVAMAAFRDREKKVAELQSLLDGARALLAIADTELTAAQKAEEAAERHATTLQAWQADIDAGARVVCPSAEQVADADAAVKAAEEAVSLGMRVRQAIQAKSIADTQSQLAKEAGTYAARLRDAARDTQDVLTDAIARIQNCPLKVRSDEDGNPRLVIATDRSPEERFDELSDGEKWPIIIGLAAGKNRLIVLPQAAFGELSDSSRDLIDRLARQHECYILTAQVDDGTLRCEALASEVAISAT